MKVIRVAGCQLGGASSSSTYPKKGHHGNTVTNVLQSIFSSPLSSSAVEVGTLLKN